jgi:hypothetical protein
MRAAEQTPVCKSFRLHLRLAIEFGSRPLGAERQTRTFSGDGYGKSNESRAEGLGKISAV